LLGVTTRLRLPNKEWCLNDIGGLHVKGTKFLLTLTAINFFLLIGLLAQGFGLARAENEAPVLRGRGLQIVDEHGRVRASISVLPAGSSQDGTMQEETVLLRLITERGRPSVKIGASEQVSGLSIAGPSGTKDTYAILQARDETSLLRLRSENGKEQVVKP
jgi:hypothetical protein